MNLRDELLDIIASALPETPEVLKFCEEDFSDMLDDVIAKIKEFLDAITKDE